MYQFYVCVQCLIYITTITIYFIHCFVKSDSKGSTPRKGNMSEAAEDKSSVKVLPTIAKISQGITREEITKVKSSAFDITYSMWDFGGQEIYYITHPVSPWICYRGGRGEGGYRCYGRDSTIKQRNGVTIVNPLGFFMLQTAKYKCINKIKTS